LGSDPDFGGPIARAGESAYARRLRLVRTNQMIIARIKIGKLTIAFMNRKTMAMMTNATMRSSNIITPFNYPTFVSRVPPGGGGHRLTGL
jgi:hypothetical protein